MSYHVHHGTRESSSILTDTSDICKILFLIEFFYPTPEIVSLKHP